MSEQASQTSIELVAVAPVEKTVRAGLPSYVLINVARGCLFAGIIALWQFVLTPVADPFYVSSPSSIGVRLWDLITDGSLFVDLFYTMESTFLGYAIGALTGIAVGFLVGRIEFIGAVLDPFLDALNSLPRVALGPLFILWLGIDLAPKVLMVASLVFFVVMANTRAGVRDVNPDYINVLRIMGADERTILRKVILPSAAGWIYASLQIALPWALIGAVIGEMIASDKGMGYQILHSGGILDSTGIFAGLVVLMIVGLTLTHLIRVLERRSARWRPQDGK